MWLRHAVVDIFQPGQPEDRRTEEEAAMDVGPGQDDERHDPQALRVRTPVGDKYVLQEMLRRNAPLGGEQSGHIIFRDYATTGDGLLTALRVFEAVRESGQDLDALTNELETYPQLLVNVRVKNKRPLEDLVQANREIRTAEAEFGDAGRILVRFSGTEPLARVMVEGPNLKRVEHFANSIAAAIQAELGA